jgi:valyl-tRNA synthetase
MFHPFLPFITEELWHGLGFHNDMPEAQGGKTIMHAPWPKPLGKEFCEAYNLAEAAAKFIEERNALVVQGRDLRRFGNIQAGKKVKFIFKASGAISDLDIAAMKILLNAEALELNAAYEPKKGTPNAQSPLGELFLPLDGLIDVEAEKARLTKELAKDQAEIDKVQQKLGNAAFVQKVPASVLDEHKKRLADWQAKFEQHKTALETL